MVLEEERQREGIDSMILEMVTGPPEQVAPCIRNALEVRLGIGLPQLSPSPSGLLTHPPHLPRYPLPLSYGCALFVLPSITSNPAFLNTSPHFSPLSPSSHLKKYSVAGNKRSQGP